MSMYYGCGGRTASYRASHRSEKVDDLLISQFLGCFITFAAVYANMAVTLFLNIQTGLLHSIRAVSYTHLDVYKRQEFGRVGFTQ